MSAEGKPLSTEPPVEAPAAEPAAVAPAPDAAAAAPPAPAAAAAAPPADVGSADIYGTGPRVFVHQVELERDGEKGFGIVTQPWTVRSLYEGEWSSVENAEQMQNLLGFAAQGGICLQRVVPNSPAHKAKLLKWDVIIAVNGTDVRLHSVQEVADLVKATQGTLTLQLLRDKSFFDRLTAFEVQTGSMSWLDNFTDLIAEESQHDDFGWGRQDVGPNSEDGLVEVLVELEKSQNGYGFIPTAWTLGDLKSKFSSCENTEDYLLLLKFAQGGLPILCVVPTSPAYHAGLRKWDVIVKVNDVDVTRCSVAEVTSAVAASTSPLKLVVARDVHAKAKASVLMTSTMRLDIDEKARLLNARFTRSPDAIIACQCAISRAGSGFGIVPMTWTVDDLATTMAGCSHNEEISAVVRFAFDGGLPIGSVVAGSPAAATGLRSWDVIQVVNTVDVRKWTAAMISEFVKNSSDPLRLIVLRNPASGAAIEKLDQAIKAANAPGWFDTLLGKGWLWADAAAKQEQEAAKLRELEQQFANGRQTVNIVDVQLTKQSGSFGFTLYPWTLADLRGPYAGSEDGRSMEGLLRFADGGVVVQEVKLTPEAQQLRRYDVVQSVNGEDVRRLPYAEVVERIKASPDTLSLRIARDEKAEENLEKLSAQLDGSSLDVFLGRGWLWGR
mmetsp:Transcript_59104/g.139089  ORF Transcript_59104/g.139089 Transcript_59104/m.139089 type:complete len:668 (+) Transcript_59104:12-2015(+)